MIDGPEAVMKSDRHWAAGFQGKFSVSYCNASKIDLRLKLDDEENWRERGKNEKIFHDHVGRQEKRGPRAPLTLFDHHHH